jgi:hypothetical protein
MSLATKMFGFSDGQCKIEFSYMASEICQPARSCASPWMDRRTRPEKAISLNPLTPSQALAAALRVMPANLKALEE